MTPRRFCLSRWGLRARALALLICWLILGPTSDGAAAAEPLLVANSNLETDADGDRWPDGWPKIGEGGSWESEGANHFIRLTSPAAGKTVMLYAEIQIPKTAEAIEFRWKQRVSDLEVGTSSWFDARIMLEFLDGDRKQLPPSPNAPATRRDTDGWVENSTSFVVPEGATILKFMPCLFQVKAGVFDLDDLALRPVDPQPIREKLAAAAEAKRVKVKANALARRAKADALLKAKGSLISNGDFETDVKADGWPDDWGRLKEGGSWGEDEDGNRFLRMKSLQAGRLIMVYRTFDIPSNTQAFELSWRQRITGLKKGKMPWFDARLLLEFLDEEGEKMSVNPSPVYSTKDTDGWVEKRSSFLVPAEALTLVIMPSLFEVEAGTFDIDDFVLKPTLPEPLIAAARQREIEIAARYVPPEAANESKWPKELRAVGNRLHNSDGQETWLQGVNAGGIETLPHDRQVIKSVVVAIDDWKANCVRVPVNDEFWYGKSPYQKDGGKDYREIIDQIVTLAANRGAYVVIDLHRYRAATQAHADFWKDCAAVYRNHPAVLFDVLNEPHGISWDTWKDGGFVGTKRESDESAFLSEAEKAKNQGFESVGMQGLVDAVRATGAKNIVIAGGMSWCNDLSRITEGYALDNKGGNGIMYSWHTYNWHTGWEKSVLSTAARYPIFLGEVGADVNKMDFIPAEAQEDPYTWVPDMLGFIQKHKLNWTGWCFHPRATPVMISDWSYTPSPFWGVFAKQALSGKPFELKRVR